MMRSDGDRRPPRGKDVRVARLGWTKYVAHVLVSPNMSSDIIPMSKGMLSLIINPRSCRLNRLKMPVWQIIIYITNSANKNNTIPE